MVVGFWLFQSRSLAEERHWFDMKLDAMVYQLQAGLAIPVWNLDKPAAEIILETALRDPDITGVSLESTDGVFAPLNIYSPHMTEPTITKRGIVTYDDRPLAMLTIYVDEGKFHQRARDQIISMGAAILLLELFQTLVLSLLLRQSVVLPLRKLKAYAASVSAEGTGTVERRSPETAEDSRNETESVAASVRSMVRQLELRYLELQGVEAELKSSLDEKEILLRELHHRVKNNLSIIYSLLYFQKERFDDPEVAMMIAGLQGRIYAIASIHQQLYRAHDFRAVDLKAYLEELGDNISESYGENERRIRFDFRIPPLDLDMEKALPCGLLVNELVTNAYRHAFPEGRGGTITVEVKEAAGMIELIVEDDGIGYVRSETGSGGMGLSISESLATQLGGTLVPSSEPGAGTRWFLRFPIEGR